MMRVIQLDGGGKAKKWAAAALLTLLMLLCITCVGTKTSHAAFSGIVKVRLTPEGQSSDVRVVPHGKYYIAQAKTVQLLDVEYKVHKSGSSVQLKYGSTVLYSGSKLTLVRASGNTKENFIVFPYSPSQKTRTNYYGNIEFSVNSGLCAVNHVYIEDYLLGVVPYEMSPSWPGQALRAQTICARNYAVKAADANPSGTWQLWDTPRSQVYRGVPGVSSTGTINYTTYNTVKSAVDGVSRRVMKYEGKYFSAYYSAWNGGETLSTYGRWGGDDPAFGYTTVKKDPYDDKRCKDAYWITRTVKRYLESSGDDINKDVQDMLIRKYKLQYDKASSTVTFKSTSTGIRGKDPSGASEVSIVYENFKCLAKFKVGDNTEEEWVTFTDTDLKQALGISSSYTAFRIVNHSNGTTTLYNVRYGHGVGMSQRGAQQMANDGKTYADILRFYYKDIGFSTLSVSAPSLPSLPYANAPTAKASGADSVRLTWKAVPGATAYRIYRKTSASGSYSMIKDGVTSTGYTNSGLTTGKTYYYKVRPYVLQGVFRFYGSTTKAASVKLAMKAPTDFSAASASYDSVRLTWDAVPGADGYIVYRKASKTGTYKLIRHSLTGTRYKNNGLNEGTLYYYKVRAYVQTGSGRVLGSLTPAVSVRPVPAAPTSVKAVSYSYSQVRLTWKAVSGADGYRVYRKASASGTYALVRDGFRGNAYLNSGLTTGTTYYYKVRAYTQVGSNRYNGNLSSYLTVKPIPSAPTDFSASSASYDSVRLTWDAVAGADGYRVYRRPSSSASYEVARDEWTETGYDDEALTTGQVYYYKVRAYKETDSGRVYGSLTPAVDGKPVPSAPTGFSADPDSYNSVHLTWDAVPGANGYRVYRRPSSSTSYEVVQDELTETVYNDGGLNTGTTYYYKVRAYTLVGLTRVYGDVSMYESAKPMLSAPTGFSATPASYNSVRLAWDAVEGADGYRVYRKAVQSGPYSVVRDGLTGTAYLNSGLTTGTTYYYKVRAYTLVGSTRVYGDVSTYVSATPLLGAPTNFSATPASSDSVHLTWDAVAGAHGYIVYRRTSSTSYEIVRNSLTETVYNDGGLNTGTTYYYMVRAYTVTDSGRVLGDLTAAVGVTPS